MSAKGLADTDGQINQFCFQYHSPTASTLGLTLLAENDGVARLDAYTNDTLMHRGVQCVGCYMVEAVLATENSALKYSPSTLCGSTVSAAALKAHPIEVSPFFVDRYQSSFICGSCHSVLNARAARLEASLSQWYVADYKQPNHLDRHQSCVTCHMPRMTLRVVADGPETTVHAHRFRGVDQALIDFPDKEVQARLVKELLQNATELDVRLNETSDGQCLFVSVTNTNT